MTTAFSEEDTQVFIIRIWRETREIKGATPKWRGVIEHMPSGERHYLQRLSDISIYITPYLVRMGMKLSTWYRFRQWLHQRKPHWRPES